MERKHKKKILYSKLGLSKKLSGSLSDSLFDSELDDKKDNKFSEEDLLKVPNKKQIFNNKFLFGFKKRFSKRK